MIRSTLVSTAFLAAGVALSGAAFGNFVLPDDPINTTGPWVRGVANSTYQEWQSFTDEFEGENLPNSLINSYGTANLQQTTPITLVDYDPGPGEHFGPSVTITGTGNMYAPQGHMTIQITVPNPGLGDLATTDVILQVLLGGVGTIVQDSVLLGDLEPSDHQTIVVGTGTGPMGDEYDIIVAWYKWDGIAGNPDELAVRFTTGGMHTQLDAVAIDTFTVIPEPASLGVFAMAILPLAARRRKRQ